MYDIVEIYHVSRATQASYFPSSRNLLNDPHAAEDGAGEELYQVSPGWRRETWESDALYNCGIMDGRKCREFFRINFDFGELGSQILEEPDGGVTMFVGSAQPQPDFLGVVVNSLHEEYLARALIIVMLVDANRIYP